MIFIKAFPRIHLTLIGMNDNGYRINGGIGFAIDFPTLKLKIQGSETFLIEDERTECFSNSEISRTINILEFAFEHLNLKRKIKIGVEPNELPTHSGFGTTTMMRLAALEGLMIKNNVESLNRDKIVELSKRGGTSGIGVN